MRAGKLAALAPRAVPLSGPVVFVNADESHCGALILLPDGTLTSVTLPKLSLAGVEKLRSQWHSYSQRHDVHERGLTIRNHDHSSDTSIQVRILGRIWTCILHPVLKALGLSEPVSCYYTSNLSRFPI